MRTQIPVQARAMSALSSNRAQPSTKELEDATLLCKYASEGNIAGLKECKDKGISLDSADYDFRTPLHLAAAVGKFDAVKWLVNNGAQLNVDRFGGLAIHDALRNNHEEIAEYLQDHRIESDLKFDSARDE